MRDAWNRVDSWLASQTVWIPEPTERHAEVLGQLLSQPGAHGDLVSDAHLAALAIEHGLTLCSTDGDFARFRDLNGKTRSKQILTPPAAPAPPAGRRSARCRD